MKLYEVTIRPEGAIGTPLKGDTLFGHFCWQVFYDPDLVRGGLEKLLEKYDHKPPLVFSSAYPKIPESEPLYALIKPTLPGAMWPHLKQTDRGERIKKRKEFKKRKWLLVGSDLVVDLSKAELLDDEMLSERVAQTTSKEIRRHRTKHGDKHFCQEISRFHNTINRLTGTTGTGAFAPYTQDCWYYQTGAVLAVFVLMVDEEIVDIQGVQKALERIGEFGYGKDAGSGLGRFSVVAFKELTVPPLSDAQACYCLSPCVPARESFSQAFFVPFVRFGKHGDTLARAGNPFKNPVIMADEGAVFIPTDSEKTFSVPYFGSAVRSLSKVCPSAVGQGYSLYLPIKMEMCNEQDD